MEGTTPVRNASKAERARHLLHTLMRAIVVGLLLHAIFTCCFHDPCPTPKSVRRVTALYAQQLRWSLCAVSVIVCFVEELHASAPVRAGLVRTPRLRFRRVSSTGTLAIDVRMSDTAESPLLHRCCCIVSLCFAARNCVQCRAFAPRCTSFFVTHLAESQKVSRLHVFYFEGRTCDRVSLASHSAILELVCVLLIAWFLVVSQR